MVNSENKVLACVDQSHFADHVADYAGWAAQRLDAPLELLHIIERHAEVATQADHSGTIGIDAQELLLDELSHQDEARSKAAREQGRIFLNRLRERTLASGVTTVDMRQRQGSLQSALREQQDDVSLFVLGRRGVSAEHTQRDLGRNVESVVRNLNQPILTVTEDFRPPQAALIAFDGGRMSRRGVQLVSQSPLFKGLKVHLLMSGKVRADSRKQLDSANKMLRDAGFDGSAELISGDPETVIARQVHHHAIDMLIMGAYSHSPIRSMLFGSKTTDLLRAAKIPALLLR